MKRSRRSDGRNAVRREVLSELVHVGSRGHEHDAEVSTGAQNVLQKREGQVDVERRFVYFVYDDHGRAAEQGVLEEQHRNHAISDNGDLLGLGLNALATHVESHEAAACVAVNV